MYPMNKMLISGCLALLVLFSSIEILAKEYLVSEIAKGLNFPWSLAFLPNKDMLVTERAGKLRMIQDGKLLKQPVTGLPDIFVQGQGGLFDVLVDPDFKNNQRIFLAFSAGKRSKNALNVISARLENMSLVDVKTILKVSPDKDTAHHFGGRMTMLADGTLLITSGDGFNQREQAQSLDSMLGKILRINSDGSIPADNPFIGQKDAKAEVFTYGHRNPQAILISQSGIIWQHEHGAKGGDELNIIRPGINYGWPAITHGVDYSGAIISPYTEAEGMEQPVTYWVPSIAPAGMTEYQGDEFPNWQGNLLIASLAERSLRRLTIKAGKVVNQEILLTELNQRLRDVRTGPDGYIYVLTDSNQGKVLKLSAK